MKMMIACGKVAPYFSKRYKLIKRLQENGYQIILGGYERGFEERILAEDMQFEYLPCERTGLNPLGDIKMLWSYYRSLHGKNISVFHSYTAKPNIYGCIAARLAGIKNIYPVVNGLGFAYTEENRKTKVVRMIMDRLYHLAFRCATVVFFQNADDAQELVKRNIVDPKKVFVISGSGVDLEEYPFSMPPEEPVFLMATRLLISKGTRTYLQAAGIVKKKYPNVRFQLAGPLDENPNSITQNELDTYRQSGVIEYLGNVSDMPAALRACSVFVLPSYYREGVPHAVLEAMSIGRAVLTTDSPGCRETVNGENGFLIAPKDVDALVSKMIWYIEHPEERKRMGMKSREYAEKRFDVDIVNESIIKTMGIR